MLPCTSEQGTKQLLPLITSGQHTHSKEKWCLLFPGDTESHQVTGRHTNGQRIPTTHASHTAGQHRKYILPFVFLWVTHQRKLYIHTYITWIHTYLHKSQRGNTSHTKNKAIWFLQMFITLLTTDSQDIKLNDILLKKFKIIFYCTITELQENAEKQLNG